MREYVKPTVEAIILQADEAIANPNSGTMPNVQRFRNNGFGNGDQTAPGNSGPNNNAENALGNKGNGKK